MGYTIDRTKGTVSKSSNKPLEKKTNGLAAMYEMTHAA